MHPKIEENCKTQNLRQRIINTHQWNKNANAPLVQRKPSAKALAMHTPPRNPPSTPSVPTYLSPSPMYSPGSPAQVLPSQPSSREKLLRRHPHPSFDRVIWPIKLLLLDWNKGGHALMPMHPVVYCPANASKSIWNKVPPPGVRPG
ncbi:hypothetical protein CMEL01_08355 [Colletotrichum melonis]|uniref:Uncharacterized protein n=1 Tax=Colletotrichum melonis TaxID=1209925 RepID=A0AAI9XHC9_9PEZI|nr:hypothetical protein CMEL01_08355 [Colletotrichum melonis]